MNPLQPSDKLIKKLFSKRQEVIDYFKENLPPILVESLDLENIQFGKEIFVGLELDESRTDQLFKIPLSFGKSLIDSKSNLYSSLSFFPKKKRNQKGLKFSNYSSNFSLQGKYFKILQNITIPWRIREWNGPFGFLFFFGYFFLLFPKREEKSNREI